MNAINTARLRAELLAPEGPYAALDVVPSTGSTNADLRKAGVEGAADRTVLIAEEQTSGVGRRARLWASPKGSGVYLSVLLRPAGVPFSALGSLAVAAGLAVTDLAVELGVDAVLKWPNDVLAGPDRGKCAGILSEAVAGDEVAVVLGIGLNVRPLGPGVEPGAGGLMPTSLAEQGARTTDRTDIAALLLAALADREDRWRAAGGDLARAGLLADYRARCETLGQEVRVLMPGDQTITGTAEDVDASGQLQVTGQDGKRHTVFAGDVVHLRPVR
ncbi:biotin--[acetyl-CoA-carboxylase] ligase [Amycolatopsis viridis]|uniref:biotin--[biotin carboxyl-carrier protein] ligase n=1 Tax=Amycolatopsis viridis TaxID=185678 RepID=A0ABX0T3J6_9PSEU|nr:biotin--[acetyl-CoA-carboxylase] ligase [Amycolatopsis viridis]NIH82480.1 BirA family biotin operon repressor/biotin-[acetyl-CoA-carboxylase] ligase [Amycolatopsis viridis]